ncbi:MAG: heavy-metal-associated domain-containing protein [Comamonas sp.]|nr:heavy-metal-associated domain-containing protein [Comamonas sp.]
MEHVFSVTGMTCGHCERAVQQALLAVDAQARVQIDRPANRVVVQSDSASREALAAAIAEEGYTVA